MQKNRLLHAFVVLLSLTVCLAGSPFRLQAQITPQEKAHFLEKLKDIRTCPLEILPVSDCRLSELEEDLYRLCGSSPTAIPVDLRLPLQQKRREIDFMRTHIDSLYYIQALQAINQDIPDWKAAMENIEKSLLYNRFFARSVIFKMNYLLDRQRNAETALRYLYITMREMSHSEKVRQMAQKTYNTLLQETENLIEKKQYRDALDLCQLIRTYCQPGFPLRYIHYKEKQLENLAYQGIYRSYYEVAEKAFNQRQYQLAQKYALRAYDYFVRHETHMGGINYALELLDKIAMQYDAYAALSEPDEKYFYLALVDTIVQRTGLVVSTEFAYDPNAEIAADIERLNPPSVPETPPAPIPAFVPLSAESASRTSYARLSTSQAKARFAQAWEQANYFRSERNFAEALAWLERARELKDEYRLAADPGFDDIYSRTVVLAVEQRINKAVYHLWTSTEAQADSLFAEAGRIAESYRTQKPEDVGTLTRLQQILTAYQSKRSTSYCTHLEKEWNETATEFYRQASFGNYALAKAHAEQTSRILLAYRQPEYATCPAPDTEYEKIARLMEQWTACTDSLNRAFRYLTEEFDTLMFIRSYLKTDTLFRQMGLPAFVPTSPTLFSYLSAGGDLQTLLVWTEFCIRNADWAQARFLLGYLNQRAYRTDYLDRLSKRIKRLENNQTKNP